MESHVRLSSSQVIEVSTRLLSSPSLFGIQLSDSLPAQPDAQFATTLLIAAQHASDHKQGAQKALHAAETFAQCNDAERSLLALAAYASHVINLETNADLSIEKLGVLADTIGLVHGALPYCHPETAAQLTRVLAQLTEEACRASALVDPSYLTKAGGDIQGVLSVAAVVWGPELESLIHDVERVFNDLLLYILESGGKGGSVQLQEKMIQDLRGMSLQVSGRTGGRRTTLIRLGIIQTLLTSWTEAAHNYLLRQSNQSQSNHEERGSGSQVAEVEAMIEQVETALRTLLTRKYRQQYGDSWPQHIETRHPQMHSYWMRNMERDQATFRTYQEHKPELLEYARLEDLKELITAQWHLFREILNFGQEDRNKMIFSEKMEQIARVRNPLAHHRSVPENELLRAKVLCTDILLAMEGHKV